MSNSNFINLDQLSLTTQSLLRKINEQSNLKVDKNTIISTTSNGSVIASINGTDIYNGETFSGDFSDLKNIPSFVESVNGDYSTNIYISSLKPFSISDIAKYNLIGVENSTSEGALKKIYNITPVSLLKNGSTYSILSIGNKASSSGYGALQLYKGGSSSNTGYIQIQPTALSNLNNPQLSTTTNILYLPHQSGTVALISDIPSWARSSTKPTYTATEVGALPSSTTYVSTFNGQSGAITYTAPVTSVNGQTGTVNLDIPNVPEWALATTKPAYTATEVGATTTSEVNSLIASAIGNINSFEVSVVASLPASDIDTHTIYFVSNSSSGDNIYDEYMYINNNWEKIGSTAIDLSNYLQKTDISDWAKAATKPTYTASEVGAAASNHTHTSIGANGPTGSAEITATTSNLSIFYFPEVGAQSSIKAISKGIEFSVLDNNRTDSTTITLTGTSLTGIPTPTENTSAANKKYVDDAIAGVTDTNTTYTLSMSGNIITLTPSTGTPQTITLPVYNGGVSS